MPDSLIPLKLPPGYVNNGTQYQSKNAWLRGNLVRFFQGTIQPLGGWAQRTLTGATILGVPNAAIAWTPDVIGVAQTPILAIGTTVGLYVIEGTVVYDITPAFVVSAGANANRIWQLETFGVYLMAVPYDDTDFTNTLRAYIWKGDVAAAATITDSGAPPGDAGHIPNPTSVVTTPERFLFLLGGFDSGTGWEYYNNANNAPSVRTVFWASQETYNTWTPSDTNTAGSFPLPTNGSLKCGARVRGGTLLLTTTDAYLAIYIGGALLYRFDLAGANCGIISTHALVALDTEAYWMGDKGFFVYNGFTKALPCAVHDYVFGNFNTALKRKVWAFANPQFGEVTWFYPSAAATEIDSYVTYSYREDHWTFGSMVRTAGVSYQSPAAVPVLLGADGKVYDHETGVARDSVVPYLESGPTELGDGDRFMSVTRMIPDEKNAGDVLLTLYAAPFPNAAETTYGPYAMANPIDLRIEARQVRVRLEGFSTTVAQATESSPFVYKAGASLLLATPSRSGTARYTQNTAVAPDESYPMPVHSGAWQIGVMRFGAKPSSVR